MTSLLVLMPVALLLGGAGLAAFLWSMRSGQFDDLDGAAVRVLVDADPPGPAERTLTQRKDTPGDAGIVAAHER